MIIGWLRRRKIHKLREQRKFEKLEAVDGKSHKYCPDGKRHLKQWFECQPGTWRCWRCGAIYGQTGIFDKEFIELGTIKSCEEFDMTEGKEDGN